MYLKQIELHGFKSFANDTILTFEKGITGIVGPNGSGKSNIADAVRWVLGERSMKQLRGADTLDVIFSGTELRKAQGFAYVNLIIDNSDRRIPISYDEIQVSRRLYRSGESEYKLNNVDCRLKDINELFYDTGIGKEGYSIIGQGQIDKILSNKPEDRRELFDEAVGIVKYKKRKIIAEKKLEEERLNLSRVSDIINEIERQIEPLKKQAEAAKEYLNLRDDLLLYESNFFVREVDTETNNILEINKNIEINKTDIKELRDKKTAFNEKYNEVENEITKLDLEIADIKDQITECTALSENVKGQINVLKEQINSEQNAINTKNDRINSYNNSIASITKEIEDDLVSLNVLKKQIEFIKTNNTEMEDSDRQLNGDLKLIVDSINEIKELSDKYSLQFDIDNRIKDISIFSNGINAEKSSLSRNKLDEINDKIEFENKNLNDLNNRLIDFNARISSTNETLTNLQNEYLSNETKLEAIKTMLERNEGYQNAVKSVLDNKNKFDGIVGTVADILNTKKDYELAIEIALGNSIQNIVTRDIETSKSIINYLKSNKVGRVTTLPLSAIKFKENNAYQNYINETGTIDLAVNLVNYDNAYQNLANYLLKNCLIVDTYDNAKVIFNKSNSSIKIVTLQGELFNPGGAISGGSYKNSSTIIGRKREFDEISKNLPILKDKINKFASEKESYSNEYNITFDEIENCKLRISELNIEKNTVTLNIINDMKLEYSNISNKTEFVTNNLSRLTANIINLFNERTQLDTDDAAKTIDDKYKQIDDLNYQMKNTLNRINELQKSVDEKTNLKNSNLSNRKEFYDAKDKLTSEQILLEQESNRLANLLEKSNYKIEEITKSMFENYNLTYAMAKEKYKEDLGTNDEIKTLVKEKRKVIQELGPININAIEEYRQIGDRYDVMTTQYDDIKKSEEMIASIVDELDTSMKNQFDTNFKRIKDEFQVVFKILFGGGKADIELVETEEKGVLDAGVAIVVQPPGKKLGNMMQLSGGEKALTAIALLFAIQNLKPSPFCLLDEIEAALDESNVDRYAEYLKNLTENTQFILITHRRGTMEKADRLYGITMQEKGITALVSVDLIEDQLN